MRLSSLNRQKIAYLMCPPVLYRALNKINTRFLGKKKVIHDDIVEGDMLKNFRKEKFNMFFKEQVVDEFCNMMEEQFKENKPVKTKKISNQSHLDELVENGFCKIEGLFTADQIKKWHDAVYPVMTTELSEFHDQVAKHGVATGKDISLTKNNVKFCYDLRSGIIRAWSISQIDSSIDSFFRDNEDIYDICNSYLSGKANSAEAYVDFKGIPNYKDSNLLLHADSVFKQLKVFLPLQSIQIINAPFIYYKKSHHVREWRLLKDFLAFTNYNHKYNSHYVQWGDIEMGRFAESYPELVGLESVVTTNIGDVIIADTRGVHGGSLLHEGYRLQLGLSYSMLGDFHNAYLPQRILDLSRNVK